MVSVSAPDARVASLLAAGQVPQVDVRATVLLRGGGAVAVPVSAFVRPERRDEYSSLLRFAFCKKVDLLERAAAQLTTLRTS